MRSPASIIILSILEEKFDDLKKSSKSENPSHPGRSDAFQVILLKLLCF